MSLYSNILSRRTEAKDSAASKAEPVNVGLKFLQDHLMSKRRAQQQNQPTPRLQTQTDSGAQSGQTGNERSQHSPEWNLEEEYDPRNPNSYELLVAEYLKQNEKRLKKPSLQLNKTVPSTKRIDLSLLDAIDQLDGDQNCDTSDETRRGTAIAPPPKLSSMPLTPPAPAEQLAEHGGIQRNPARANGVSRVVLLQNMVGPDEVDDSLEAETKEECSKYGTVNKCLIYKFSDKSVADDEAVRIFVEFNNVESAARAAADLNGRYFGGRVVRASFYNSDKFSKYELGQPVDR